MPDDHRDTPPSATTSDEWELFLLSLRYRQAKLVTLSGNEPFLLAGADRAWVVYNGAVDVFAVRLQDGAAAGARRHLFRAHSNQLLLGTDLAGREVGLLASCTPETQLLQLKRAQLAQLAGKDDNAPLVAILLDDWLRLLSLAGGATVRPKDYRPVVPGQEVSLAPGEIARPARRVVWVQPSAGRMRFMSRSDLPEIAGDGPLPLTDHTWLLATEDTTLRAFDTVAMFEQDSAWAGVTAYHDLVLDLAARDVARERDATGQLILDQAASDARRVQVALADLAGTLGEDVAPGLALTAEGDPLLAACRVVGDALGVTVEAPPDVDALQPYQDPLTEIARASRLRVRRVLLREDWHRHDNGPLLAYRGADHHPVALVPLRAGRYELHDPVTGEQVPVDDRSAGELNGAAYVFYRPFPDRPLSAWDLVRFSQRGARQDLLSLLVVGIMGGLLGLLTPVITGVIFGRLVPSGERDQLLLMGAVLVVSALATALFQMVRGIALLRIEGRSDSALQAALWDRLLSLPADFFRRYSSGDLTHRAMGISYIKQILSSTVTLAVFTGVFSWFNVLLLFYYDARLALVTVGLVLVSMAVTAALGWRVLRFQRHVEQRQGEIAGLIGQLVGGIAKLRVAGAEGRAFALWAGAFSEQKRLAYRARSAHNYFVVWVGVFPIVAAMLVFAAVYEWSGLSTGAFLAFNAAFTQFLSAGLQLSAAGIEALAVVPIYERLRPILQALPEVDEQKTPPGELSGRIEVSHVSFRYEPDGPLVLEDVSLTVESGAFVALVGPSGSGKSTLLRLLLGFEQPDSGAIYFDGHALAETDLRAVRRQMGVVLQHSQVMTGTIQDNILGASNLTVEDAWEAAQQAGIAEDIRAMPMGMQTYISEGGSTFSGGQRQRLLIARALVTRPRIIFFDEATSALDDRSQALVTESLKRIDATRIVIAHRLSTIVDADHILVMERGRVVESGTYQDLIARGGAFAALARRQLI